MSSSSLPSSPPPPYHPATIPRPSSIPLLPTSTLPLRIPLEVLEQIIFNVFPAPNPSPFALDPTPPRGLSHLLLVSKGFSSLVLPHFLRSISIKDSRDWDSLFNQWEGFFGDDGKEGVGRRAMVKELRLNTDREAMIPLDYPRLNKDMDEGRDPLDNSTYRYIIPLLSDAVQFPNLKRVVFPRPPSTSLITPSLPPRANELKALLEALKPRTMEGRIKAGVNSRIKIVEERMIVVEDQRRNLHTALPWTTVASSLHLPFTFFITAFTIAGFESETNLTSYIKLPSTPIVFHAVSGHKPNGIDPRKFLKTLSHLGSSFGRRPYALVGFGKEWRILTVEKLEFGSRLKDWEWELEDGSRVGLFSPLAQ